MSKENSFKGTLGVVCCTALFLFGFVSDKISPRLQQKLNAAVESTFEVQEFEMVSIPLDEEINVQATIELGNENLFTINVAGQSIGYAYLGQAPSMKDIFDYVVLFNPDLSIRKSKVLIYREDYGRQIGSQRWLKQFIGKRPGASLHYGEDIDAISGATISAKSMTKAVQEVLKGMEVLQQNNLLP